MSERSDRTKHRRQRLPEPVDDAERDDDWPAVSEDALEYYAKCWLEYLDSLKTKG